jgi:hypothetical protein
MAHHAGDVGYVGVVVYEVGCETVAEHVGMDGEVGAKSVTAALADNEA